MGACSSLTAGAATMTTASHLTYVGHATVLIEMDGARVLTDPLLRQRTVHLRRRGPQIDPAWLEGIDAVLLSHLHLDGGGIFGGHWVEHRTQM